MNSNVNALHKEDAPIHAWYRFVLSFPPHLVRRYIDKFDLGPDSVILDPFCGTGTTLVEAKKNGIPSIGVEALTMPAFAAKTKLDWLCDSDQLNQHADQIALQALDLLARQGISDAPSPSNLSCEDKRLLYPDAESEILLFKNAISPLPLHKSMVLISSLERLYDPDFAAYEQIALASALMHSISNLKFGPEVGIGKVKKDAAVVSEWKERVHRIATDLHLIPNCHVPSKVYQGDARRVETVLEPGSVDAVITSPPYPNEKDYTRTVRLESVLLGFMRNRSHLRASKENMLRSNTRGVFSRDTDDKCLRPDSDIRRLASRIEEKRIALGKTSGFERRYAQVVLQYFGGMTRHLRSLSKVLKPGARLAYVVGDQASYFRIMIRTGELLADIATQEGYQVDGIELFRTRHSTVTKQHLREEVLLLSWAG